MESTRRLPLSSRASWRLPIIIRAIGRMDVADITLARTPSRWEPSWVRRWISVAERMPSLVGRPCCASLAAERRCFISEIPAISFQCEEVTSGTEAIWMPSEGFTPGRVLTNPHGFRSIRSLMLTWVGSAKMRLLRVACTLSILLRSNQEPMSWRGSIRS